MQWLAFDIEGDGHREVNIKDGNLSEEVTKVHCICIRDVRTGEEWWFTDDVGFPQADGTLADGFAMLMGADLIIAHNGTDYDMPVLRRLVAPSDHKMADEPKMVDTLVWSRFLYPDIYSHPNKKWGKGKPNSLKAWGLRLRCHKGDFDGPWDKLTNEMLEYCGQDVRVCEAIFRHLLPLMQKWKVHCRLEHEVSRIITRQSCNGVGFDYEQAGRFHVDLLAQRAEAYDQLMRAFPPAVVEMKLPAYWIDPETGLSYRKKGDVWAKQRKRLVPGPPRFKVEPFNPGSDQQVVARLVEKYGWEPEAYTEPTDTFPEGQTKVDEVILGGLDYPEAALLNRFNMIEKRLSMLKDWMTRAECSRDGRIHGSVNTNGTPTARMTHSQPNQTQVTKVKTDDDGPIMGYEGRWGWESRSLFGPREGWVQVGADAQGLELRMLGNRTWPYDDGSYATILIEHDVHTYNMEMIAILQTRPQSKETFYAGIYGAGVKKQGKTILHHKSLSPAQRKKYDGMSIAAVGQTFKEQLNAGIPALGKATDRCKSWCRQRGYLVLLDGRRAPIRSEHLALNTQLQGDGSVLCKLALVLADRAIRRKHGLPLMECKNGQWEWMINAHDEMQMECHPDIAESCGKIMAWAYAEAGRRLKCRVPTPGEYKIGSNWAETH
jgi:hypothetical protein